MTISDIANHLLVDPTSDALVDYAPWYVGFNWIEACCWFAFAAFILIRHLRFRRTWFEPMYALSFLVFGLTDVVETGGLTVLLLLLKMMCVIALIALRHLVIQHHPGWRF